MKQLVVIFTLIFSIGLSAQVMPNDRYDMSAVALGLNIGPQNWGIDALIKTDLLNQKTVIIGLGEMKSRHDIKYQSNQFFDAQTQQKLFPNAYLLGKINSLYNLTIGIQNRKLLSLQTRGNEFEISVTYQAGIGLGMLKPYYMQLLSKVQVNNEVIYEVRDEKYTPENAKRFISQDYIYGRSKWSKGLSEISMNPNLFGGVGVSARFGQSRNIYQEVFFNTQLTAFLQKNQLNVADSPSNFIPMLNLGVRLGKKW